MVTAVKTTQPDDDNDLPMIALIGFLGAALVLLWWSCSGRKEQSRDLDATRIKAEQYLQQGDFDKAESVIRDHRLKYPKSQD